MNRALEAPSPPAQTTITLSIITLYNYVHTEGYEHQLHLVFMVDGLAAMLLNETNLLLKAATMDRQYVLAEQMQLIEPKFGDREIEVVSLRERELAIEEKVENIISLDLALLRFVGTLPDLVERNSFKLPTNVDADYLIGEYMTIKEKQIVLKISKALELYNLADFNDAFEAIPKLDRVVFNNDNYTSRLPDSNKVDASTMTTSSALEHEYRLLIDFCDLFFGSSSLRSVANAENIPTADILNIGVDVRQVLYAMSSMFATDEENTNRRLKLFFEYGSADAIDDMDTTLDSSKRLNSTNRSLRESRNYSNKFLILLIYFLSFEEDTEDDEDDEDNVRMPRYVEELRNQCVLTLTRMLEHLLEYIQFKSSDPKYKIKFSRLPLCSNRNCEGDMDDASVSQRRPISVLIKSLQYALNFGSFVSSTSI